MTKKRGLNQFYIRIIGALATIVCCLGFVLPETAWLSWAGWIAFPIFAYLLQNGLSHSVNKLMYAERLFVFAILAEVPYDLLTSGKWWDLSSQNVLFTLLLGYLCIWAVNSLSTRLDNLFVSAVAAVGLTVAGTKLAGIMCSGFAAYGILFIMLFYVADKASYEKLLQLIFVLYICFSLSSDTVMSLTLGGIQYELCVQIFSLAALIPIWLYNGERGPNTIRIKIAYYLWFPVIMLIIGLIKMYLL